MNKFAGFIIYLYFYIHRDTILHFDTVDVHANFDPIKNRRFRKTFYLYLFLESNYIMERKNPSSV